MISYDPLFRTMRRKGVTTYRLIKEHNISSSLINRLRHNQPITTVTLNDLCRILDCGVEDILLYTPDENE